MQQESQFQGKKGIIKLLQNLFCCHENARFSSLLLLRGGFTIKKLKNMNIQNEFVEGRFGHIRQ